MGSGLGMILIRKEQTKFLPLRAQFTVGFARLGQSNADPTEGGAQVVT